METKTVIYNDTYSMSHGISSMESEGWSVVSTTPLDQGWDPAATCCLGCLFLPLALLGKKRTKYQVVFSRPSTNNLN